MPKRERFIKDLGWKIFSGLLATAIWLTVSYKNQDEAVNVPRPQTTYDDLPVTAVSLPAGGNAQISPTVVAVTVSGRSATMSVLQANQIRAIVNLAGLASGNDFQRTVEVAVPPGVSVISVNPPQVTVTISNPAAKDKEKQP